MDNKVLIKVFISYSHKDEEWFKRLQVHLKPLQKNHGIDIWDDTRLTPGSKWREKIIKAVDDADIAILIISADYLSSDFIIKNELPPLLKAGEEEGKLILPIIASPSLFNLTPDLAVFKTINDPSRPLLALSKCEQEDVFLKVAETLLKRTEARQSSTKEPSNSESPHIRSEDFLNHSTWIRLIKIGNWLFDEGKGKILGSGKENYLLSRMEYGEKSSIISVELSFTNFREHLQYPDEKINAGIVFGWNSDKVNPKYYHLMFTGEKILLERIGFRGGSPSGDSEHLTDGEPMPIEEGIKHLIRIELSSTIDVFVNKKLFLSINRPTGVVGRVGLRPWRSQMECFKFLVEERD